MSCRFIGHLLRCLLHSTGYNISVIVVTQPMDWCQLCSGVTVAVSGVGPLLPVEREMFCVL